MLTPCILPTSTHPRGAYTPTTLRPSPLTIFPGLRAIHLIVTVHLTQCQRSDMLLRDPHNLFTLLLLRTYLLQSKYMPNVLSAARGKLHDFF
jgi:hypothetical protein